MENIKELVADDKTVREFYRDLCGTVNGEATCTCQCVMSAEGIAQAMGMSVSETKIWCDAMVHHGITERQGGGYVI